VRTSRLTLLLAAVAVGALALAGLFIHGPTGGVLLGMVVAILVFLSSATWPVLHSRGRVVRGVVIGAVAALAVVKFAGKA
jgi:uncharacterized protein DUF6703